LHPWVSLDATAYDQGTITASGEHVYVGEVACNLYPLGTRLQVSPPVFGLNRFRVEDRIGFGSQIDFYTQSYDQAVEFGRRVERVRVVG
jgi:3D (Asp-Asp-Asp) domain-containing protein